MIQKLALIYGGKSGEHDVSVKTAYSIMQAVDYQKYYVIPVYVTLEGLWLKSSAMFTNVPEDEDVFLDFDNYETIENVFSFFSSVNVAFPVIHGPTGEDGSLQGFLELMDVPYVGSAVMGSAIGLDKAMMKIVFEQHGIPQGPYLTFTKRDFLLDTQEIINMIQKSLSFPVFVKPANLGSSIGISKASTVTELLDALELAFEFDTKIVVEAMIKGRELEIGVLGHSDLKTSKIGEILTTKDFYDYEAKYENQAVTQMIIPANIPLGVKQRMSKLAKKVFKSLDCSGLARVDFFWSEQTNELFVNEINTLPGFTQFSMYPALFKEAGISYQSLISRLLHLAHEKHEEKKQKQIISNHTVKE
ncbi:D-alanine--D-alanine ligase [Priestia megaterium]|nr:D-alanine--D-alanine ligase [Priestia megaterium]